MKVTGIIRRIDDLGRVVIPKEIRRSLRLREGDPLEIFLEDGAVIYKKYTPLSLQERSINAAVHLLNRSHIQFSIYDTTTQVASGGFSHNNFPRLVPDEWEFNRSIFKDKDNNADVYPIIVNGELFGYLCAVTADHGESLFVEAIVQMIAASLS